MDMDPGDMGLKSSPVGLYSLHVLPPNVVNLEAARLGMIMIISLWNFIGIAAALLRWCLSDVRAIGNDQTRISRLENITRYCGNTSVGFVNIGPVVRNFLSRKLWLPSRISIHHSYNNTMVHTQLTHRGRSKMACIFQTIYLDAFYWMKMREFRFVFHWMLFISSQLTIIQHWFR